VSANAAAVADAFRRVLAQTEAAQHELDRLDALPGDGDHGVTMVLGWRAVVGSMDEAHGPGRLLTAAARAFADVGGSAGPLWGTALLRAGRALGSQSVVGLDDIARAATAAVNGMQQRGRCKEGERTVVDAMGPAARALEKGRIDGATLADSLAAAAAAAEKGAQRTESLVPRHGRAALAPETARGNRDPGAVAAAVFWRAIADAERDDDTGLVREDRDTCSH
jgi:dihydroxyacetone kinase-like protein